MSIKVAATPYRSPFIFGDSRQKAANESLAQSLPASAMVTRTPAVAAPSPSFSLSTTLDQAGFAKGGSTTQRPEAGDQNNGSDGDNAKLQTALSTLIGALGPASAGNGVQDAIQAIRDALSPTTSAAPPSAGDDGQSVPAATDADTVKPNLDALNRVLSHYTAQSAASATVLTLVS